MKTLLLCFSLALACVASAQPIPGESLRDTMVRQQFKDKLDEMERKQSTDNSLLQMQHQEQSGQLDELNRKLDEMAPDNTEGQ